MAETVLSFKVGIRNVRSRGPVEVEQGTEGCFSEIYFSEMTDLFLIGFIWIPLCHFACDAGAEVLNLRYFNHRFGC